MIHYVETNGTDPDFAALCAQLDAYLDVLAGGRENRAAYVPHNMLDNIHDVVLAYDGDTPVGCASFKQYDAKTAEIKRVFVAESHRRQGIGAELMRRLEQKAVEQGYTACILETAKLLPHSMNLYVSLSYQIIPNYGVYAEMPESTCMKKIL